MNEIRKASRSTHNRIQSILEDAEYVNCVEQTYKKPIVPNKRCGTWYVSPELRSAESYFKSTDGHTTQWAFSLKRLNLHLLPLIEKNRAIIIVDSTRRGKVMPDALSKTVPIWCAVLNRALFGTDPGTAKFPGQCVSASEQDMIRQRIDQWADLFKSEVPANLVSHLSKPLRPMWVTPNSMLPMTEFQPNQPIFEDAHAVVLCTASRQAQDGQDRTSGFAYVQGAADDHELWAPSEFSADMLWENKGLHERGLADEVLLRKMQEIIGDGTRTRTGVKIDVNNVHPYISLIHAPASAPVKADTSLIDLRWRDSKENGEWPLKPGKRGSKQLAFELPKICEFYETLVFPTRSSVTIAADEETDFAECVALMLDCRYFEADGTFRESKAAYVSKDEVNRRNLALIAKSGRAPSRTTQNIIGSFLRSS